MGENEIEVTEAKRTPLYEEHLAAGGKVVPFAGFALPVEYPDGLIAEHSCVRSDVGMFDVSHMGEVLFEGSGALACLNHLLTNDFSNLEVGRCRYSLMCYEDGGVVDDLIVYRRAQDKFLVVVNAANKDKDVAWMKEHLLSDTDMRDVSERVAQIALQGPRAKEVLGGQCRGNQVLPEKYYSFVEGLEVAGFSTLTSQTGYTGEEGYEVYCKPEDACEIWRAFAAAGAKPCGLGARDTLRMEAAMPLYGHEMDENITPFDTGLAFGVKLSKDDFLGKTALQESKEHPRFERVGLEVQGRGIVREHCDLQFAGTEIGHTTSGTFAPTLGKAVAMALVKAGCLSVGDEVVATVRKRQISCKVVPLPFYKRSK